MTWRTAAQDAGLDPDRFQQQLHVQNAVPLAIRPITLEFLIGVSQHQRAQLTRKTLYLEGCRILCDEKSDSRLASPQLARPRPERRLAIAAQLAAALIFARKSAIWDGPPYGENVESDVLVREIVEATAEASERVSVEEMRDVLGSNLFITLTPHRRVFAHQTYAEFLAAHYATTCGLTDEQILTLVTHPGDPDGRIVPQLAETVAWIATGNSGVFDLIIKVDPQLLLRSDVATASFDDKQTLVAALLRAFDRGTIVDELSLRDEYGQLDHPQISQQLLPHIVDRSKEIIVRRAAIDIAEQCSGARDLSGIFADLALDASEMLQVRVQAAHAVGRVGEIATRKRLVPLITSASSADMDDDLKGTALHALWPNLIAIETVFASLISPKKDSYYGAYDSFIVSTLIPQLRPNILFRR